MVATTAYRVLETETTVR